MHAHAAHEGQRADQNAVILDLCADAVVVIDAEGGQRDALAVLLLQKTLKMTAEWIAGRLERREDIGDRAPGGVCAVELHAVEGDAVRGEEILVAQDQRMAASEDLRTMPDRRLATLAKGRL